MKVKELLKEMDKANKFVAMVGDDKKFVAEVMICDYHYFHVASLKEFEKELKKEWIKEFCDAVYGLDIELENGRARKEFDTIDMFGYVSHNSIEIAIYKKY